MVKFRVAKAITSGIPPTFVVIKGVPDEIASATLRVYCYSPNIHINNDITQVPFRDDMERHCRYIGPTIYARPGVWVNITLVNQLKGVGRRTEIEGVTEVFGQASAG